MQASYYQGNKIFQVGECVPQSPKADEVQLKVAYCGICGTDTHIYLGHMDKRVKMPQVIGHEMSGEIAALGENVRGWKLGERVVVRPLHPCGNCPACQAGHQHICQNLKFLGIDTPGAFQSYWTVPAHTLHRLPAGVAMDEAAVIEPIAVACHDVRLAEVKPGEEVVIIGGGPIGTLIALVARQAGGNVLVSEINPYRINLARQFGFDVVNPNETDLVTFVEQRTKGAGADVVFEVSGTQNGALAMTQLARTRGRVVVVAIFSEPTKVNLQRVFWRELRFIGVRVYEPQDFEKAIQLVAQKALPVAQLISARQPLENLQKMFEQITSGADMMKVLIQPS